MFNSVLCRPRHSKKRGNFSYRKPLIESLQARELMASDVIDSIQPPKDISSEEQVMIELVNRARANPTAEATRYGVDLNAGIPASQMLSSTPKQPLAPVASLQTSASLHATDLLMRDYFDHNAKEPTPNGKTPSDRAIAAGYGRGVGENLALLPLNGLSQGASVQGSHRILFESPGHRSNILGEGYNEIGVGIETGDYAGDFFQGNSNATMITTENFGTGDQDHRAITGVVYSDTTESNNFYEIGEGVSGMRVIAVKSTGERFETTTGVSGGYALQVPEGAYNVFVAKGNETERLVGLAEVHAQNVKLDVLTNRLTQPFQTDTNSDGILSPLDALVVINYLNRNNTTSGPTIHPINLDVNRDGRIEQVDALMVINELNRRASGEMSTSSGEAEGTTQNISNSDLIAATAWSDPNFNSWGSGRKIRR